LNPKLFAGFGEIPTDCPDCLVLGLVLWGLGLVLDLLSFLATTIGNDFEATTIVFPKSPKHHGAITGITVWGHGGKLEITGIGFGLVAVNGTG
jgi:hypothetical protein